MSDRSSALLTELQEVCRRILTSEARSTGDTAALTNIASVANGTAVAHSLEALRRQCVDNHDQVAELKRSVDGHRGVVAGDSAANGKMLVALTRSLEALGELVERDRREHQQQHRELVRTVESLRVGLAGFSASNRQQAAEMRGSVESLQGTMGSFGERVQTVLNTLGGQIQSALDTMSEQIAAALQASTEQVGREIDRHGETLTAQGEAYEALTAILQAQHTGARLDELETMISVGLPKFSEEIQASLQQSLLEVSRTFRLTEREHGNRMSELHRDFDNTVRRLETSLHPRSREAPVSPA